MNKLPTFAEWLQETDPEMYEEGRLKSWAAGLAGAGAVAGLYGLSQMNKPAPVAPQEPAPMVRKADDLPQAPQIKPSAAPVDQPAVVASARPGKTFPMKGGRSGYADVRATIERPNNNTWEFTIVGHIEPNHAITQAKDLVQKELGAKTQSGLSADFDPTDDGMKVTVHFTPAHQRQRALEGN